MNKNRLLRVAAALGVLVVLSTATLPGGTGAKYAAKASSSTKAQVAGWEVKLTSNDVSVTPLSIAADPVDPDANAAAVGSYEGVILLFRGRDSGGAQVEKAAWFEVEFVNDSDVTVRFTPWFTVVTPTDSTALATVKSKIKFYTDWDGTAGTDITTTGVVLDASDSETVAVVIEDCTFSGLKIGAYCVQID